VKRIAVELRNDGRPSYLGSAHLSDRHTWPGNRHSLEV